MWFRAFLFAALNILEALYEACIDAMQGCVDDSNLASGDGEDAAVAVFRAVLDDIAGHPKQKYFVLKSIVVGNLYGVDLMEEASEICKLRLFLKLVAQVDETSDWSRCPDIDLKLRARKHTRQNSVPWSSTASNGC